MALVLQVKLLLTHHADPTICNKELKTPLDLACEFGRYRVRKTSLHFNFYFSLVSKRSGKSISEIETAFETAPLSLNPSSGGTTVAIFLTSV